MAENSLWDNPFKVLTPEGMSAQDAVDLFVEVSYFKNIYERGHTMLNGPRGSGKSMLFRYLMPDCQMAAHDMPLSRLPFFAVLISIKNTAPNLTELRRLQDSIAQTILNEHALTSFVAAKVFKSIASSLPDKFTEKDSSATNDLYYEIANSLRECGWDGTAKDVEPGSPTEILHACANLCDQAYSAINHYAKRITFRGPEVVYESVLCDFLSFLFPTLSLIRELPYFPSSAPIYLLIDDADYLTLGQTKVLNSWLATRTQSSVSIKVSTQHNYKTYSTSSGQLIRPPHDYQEVNITEVYTTKRSSYQNNVRAIIDKRLRKAKIDVPATDFFPNNKDQEREISMIAEELVAKWKSGKGRGTRASDDVLRYARPEYFKRLAGTSKSTPSYSYAGLDQLTHISSGQVRYVLQPAAQMYDEQKVRQEGEAVRRIDVGIQDEVLRRDADEMMFKEFDDLRIGAPFDLTEGGMEAELHETRIVRLQNLVKFLGGLFRRKLISDDSERRVFSVAVTGDADKDVEDIFSLGATYGYFHKSSIGNKEGTGRTRLYILTRRLAPYFGLDPSSFAGYQFVTNEILRVAMIDPGKVLNVIVRRREKIDEIVNSRQLNLELS